MKKIKKKILIVEDDLPILGVLVEMFEREKFEVLKARDGEKGLNMAIKKKPDLILLDIVMPKMDGVTVLQKLREDKWGKDVPIILLTNLISAEKASEAAQSGVRDYLVKTDWKLEDVVKKVRQKLEI